MESKIKEVPMEDPEPSKSIDFTDTKIAFSTKSDKELKNMGRLFALMNKSALVNIGSKLGLLAFKLRLPFVDFIVKKTIFKQFCGGESLMDCQNAIDTLYRHDSLTILDYGAEGKSSEEDFNRVMEETMRAIEFAASNNSVPVVSTKITGLVDNDILIGVQNGDPQSEHQQRAYDQMVERVDKICKKASELKVGVFVDAEESWLQEPIDDLVMEMMAKYNHGKVIVYNTYQLYRHDKLAQLKSDHQKAIKMGFLFGAKLVRGAYMEKERERALEMNYPSPIQPDKESTDRDFDEGVDYCIRNYQQIASCCASHNVESNRKQAKLIEELGLQKDHPHFNFCQLYGMSDYITFNIGKAGYNVAKYVPYGPIRDVVPYLIRRAQENTSVTGEMSRELSLIKTEIKRRGI
ncbi:MAG: proline dehydrogenase family protein [Saprospiraceae bacterium]|nr:proline dehydrogenase family protein [Saprospiraceae bacterium]